MKQNEKHLLPNLRDLSVRKLARAYCTSPARSRAIPVEGPFS